MSQMTHLAHNLEKTEYVAQYDDAAKRLVSDKQVLARIVKGTVEEFKDYTIDEIIDAIEGEPEVAKREVYPGKNENRKDPGAIHGMNPESAIPGEGKVTYDIYFYVLTKEKILIKVIINIELQKEYYVGYHFGSRGVFYGARMISEQLDKEFFADDYDKMKKVYSIWICMNAPEKYANTITECKMEQRELYGAFPEDEKCDYLSVIIIRLSGRGNSSIGNELIKMLTILLSDEVDSKTKMCELQEKYGMIMTEKVEGGLGHMCNLGEGLYEKAERIGEMKSLVEIYKEIGRSKEETIENLINKFHADEDEIQKMMSKYWVE